MNNFADKSTLKGNALQGEIFISELLDYLYPAHIGNQNIRYNNRAISLLIIFQNCRYRTTDSQSGPVQSMNKFRLILRTAAELDIFP